MASCTSCGHDVTGKKFCSECGTPVQPQSLTQTCIACHAEVPKEMAFCTNCGQSMRTSSAPGVQSASVAPICANCGKQNNPGVNFCSQCGSPLSNGSGLPLHQTMYSQPPQYSQYPQQTPQYGAQYPQQPMMNQQPMVLRCPICMAMAPLGTPNCLSCRTSLANVAPTPANMPMQSQQGGMFQGPGGNMAMGALGGAAAVIGGEILLHELEHGFDRNRDYGDRGGDGLLGGLGDLANDVGLF